MRAWRTVALLSWQQKRLLELMKKGSTGVNETSGEKTKMWSLEFFRDSTGVSPSSPSTGRLMDLSDLTLAHTAHTTLSPSSSIPTRREAIPTG